MNIDDARQLLDKVTSQLQVTRNDHIMLQSAISVLYDGAKEHQESLTACKEGPKNENDVSP